jgi:thymidylate synthase
MKGINMNGSIPVITVTGKSIAEVWEKSVLETWDKGCEVPTKYDKPGDPPSKDCSMVMVAEEPWSDPMIHKLIPCGLEDLEEYVQEVVLGIKDSWQADPGDSGDARWNYTYHDRWVRYGYHDGQGGYHTINQLDHVIDQLAKAPNNRRLQMITWRVDLDPTDKHSPCCQSIWVRILPDEKGESRLNMNVRFRSRDALDAAFMNIFAFVHLQKYIADRVAEKTGKPCGLGRYMDMSDSYHIYGSRHEYFKVFRKRCREEAFEDRVFNYHDEMIQQIFREAREKIPEKLAEYANTHKTGFYDR